MGEQQERQLADEELEQQTQQFDVGTEHPSPKTQSHQEQQAEQVLRSGRRDNLPKQQRAQQFDVWTEQTAPNNQYQQEQQAQQVIRSGRREKLPSQQQAH